MSVQSEINRIKGSVSDAYTALSAKGATIPATKNVDSLSATIMTVPTGITPTGSISITANGTYDVTQKASANVNVPTGYVAGDIGTYEVPKNVTGSIYGNIEGFVKGNIQNQDTSYSSPTVWGNIECTTGLPAIAGVITGGSENSPAVAGSILNNNPSYNAIESNSSSYPTVGGNIVNTSGGNMPVVHGNIQGSSENVNIPTIYGSVVAQSPSHTAIECDSTLFATVCGGIKHSEGAPAIHGDIYGGAEYVPAIFGNIYCNNENGIAIDGDVYGKITGIVHIYSATGSNVFIDTNLEEAVLRVELGSTTYGIHVS